MKRGTAKTHMRNETFCFSSQTAIPGTTEYLANGIKEQWYRQKDGSIAVVHILPVQDDDCVSFEFDVIEVIPVGGLIGELKRAIQNYYDTQ